MFVVRLGSCGCHSPVGNHVHANEEAEAVPDVGLGQVVPLCASTVTVSFEQQ